MEKEIWKDIIGYEGLYQVSNMGRVKSLEKKCCRDNYNRVIDEFIKKTQISKKGYINVSLTKNKNKKTFKVHRLVAQAFIPNPNNYPQVNHLNEDKTDNRVENLEWCTQEQNINYGVRNEKASKGISIALKGKKKSQEHRDKLSQVKSKPIVQIDKSGLIIGVYDSARQASKELGINRGNICGCCNGRYKSAGGYQWKYLEELKKAG